MQSLIAYVDKRSVLSELSKNITVLQVIQWLNVAVDNLKPQTIKSCFVKAEAGFYENEIDDKQDDNEEYEDVPQILPSDSENEDKEGNNEKNDEENQLKIYKESLIYIKSLEQFSLNKICDSELLETISWAKIKVEKSIATEKTRQKTLH